MPIGIQNLEWLDHNSQRRYPLADDAEGVDETGSFRLPTDFLVGLVLPVHAGEDVDPARFFVERVGVYATGYAVFVSYQPASGPSVPVAAASIPKNTFTRNSTYTLGGGGDFFDSSGHLIVGRTEAIDEQPPGFWTLTLETGRLDPSVVWPIIRGVSSITCVTGDQASFPIQGDVRLTAGANIRLDVILSGGDDPEIRINAITGEGLVDECVCTGDAVPGPPIERVNGIAPTSDGNFLVVGSDCIKVEPIANGVRLVDVCAQPCCGCAELERITADLARLNQEAETVDQFVQRLDAAVSTMNLTVLGARLRDQGCAATP